MESPVPFTVDSSSHEVNGLFKQILDNLHEGVYFTDLERRITYWNKGAEALTGFSAQEVVGKRCADRILMHVNDSGHLLCEGECPLSRTLADGRAHEAEVYFHHKSGARVPAEVRISPIRDKDGKVVGAVEIFNDNSRHRAVREKAVELTKLAFLDPASQVANRRYLDKELDRQLDRHSKHGVPFGILLADLDEFKNINDTYGHVAGDATLVVVAKTLTGCLRASDVLGRWGGDEFLVILPSITNDILESTSERCRALVARSSVPVESGRIQVTISLGSAMVVHGDSAESLLHRADQHMYSKKQSGRDGVSL
ncbi:MAG: diguanylate cyclase domain-containing protein [Terriglobia bacterium]